MKIAEREMPALKGAPDFVEKHILWKSLFRPGLEYFQLTENGTGYHAKSRIVGMEKDQPFFVEYEVDCDFEWLCKRIRILHHGTQKTELYTRGAGYWFDKRHRPIPKLYGCTDIDISVTPFTNTLPIRRLNLAVGARTEIKVVYFDIDSSTIMPMGQAYTRLSANVYRYENLSDDFKAEVVVDADGFVEDYPPLFRRVNSAKEW